MTTARFRLFLDPVIRQLAPSFDGLVLYVDGIENSASDGWSQSLLDAAWRLVHALPSEPAKHPHMLAWASVYARFGARPKAYSNGCLALASRERLPSINVLVDLYNSVALEHMLPIGGEDWDTLASRLLRTRALGHEPFLGNSSDAVPQYAEPGEPIWVDAAGVTTRRFNWRQAKRTRITEATRAAYFVLDAVAPYSRMQLETAADGLARRIEERWPRARMELSELASLDPKRPESDQRTRTPPYAQPVDSNTCCPVPSLPHS
jgi:DNA/RNA-binding domain of Phe-tRNA-synthetase-like protein